jgi:WD40 repeat protein
VLESLIADDVPAEKSSMTISDVHTPVLSRNGKLLLVDGDDPVNTVLYTGILQLWDTIANKKVIDLVGDDGLAAFSPDGKLLAVHQTNRTVLYDTAELKRGNVRVLVTCPDRDKPVNQVAFSADGKILYVVSDNRVRLYGVGS